MWVFCPLRRELAFAGGRGAGGFTPAVDSFCLSSQKGHQGAGGSLTSSLQQMTFALYPSRVQGSGSLCSRLPLAADHQPLTPGEHRAAAGLLQGLLPRAQTWHSPFTAVTLLSKT